MKTQNILAKKQSLSQETQDIKRNQMEILEVKISV